MTINTCDTTDLIYTLRHTHDAKMLMSQAADEIERLEELCAAYKGQVESGAAEIERLQTALIKIAKYDHHWGDNKADTMVKIACDALEQKP